jgi:HEAT repeat protein
MAAILAIAGCSSQTAKETGRPPPKPDVKSIIPWLKSDDPQVRKMGAERLEQIGKDAKEAVPDLVKLLLEDSDSMVRAEAREALEKIDPQALEEAEKKKRDRKDSGSTPQKN